MLGIDIPGYAYGGIIGEEGLYRAGEFGKKEGIIPLENKASLKVIGSTIAAETKLAPTWSMFDLSSNIIEDLQSAIGLKNAGIATTGVSSTQQNTQETSRMVQDITQRVLESILPILANSKPQNPTAYIGHFIGNDAGIRELSKRMEVIKLEEGVRRG